MFLLQIDPSQDGFEVDGVLFVAESVMAQEADVLPGRIGSWCGSSTVSAAICAT